VSRVSLFAKIVLDFGGSVRINREELGAQHDSRLQDGSGLTLLQEEESGRPSLQAILRDYDEAFCLSAASEGSSF